MKKLINAGIIVIIAAMLLSLTACGSNVGDKNVVLSGKSFVIPIKGADILNQGFKLPDGYNEDTTYKAKTKSVTSGLELADSAGNKIEINVIYNDQDDEKPFSDCNIHSIVFYPEKITNKKDYALPGGITLESTYDDIIKTYGNQKDNPKFDTTFFSHNDTYNFDQSLYYGGQKDSHYNFSFFFNDDKKTIKEMKVEYNYYDTDPE